MNVLILFSLIIAVNGECPLDVSLKRQVIRDGFHKELHSLIDIVTNESAIAECTAVQIELMPSGAYVNPYQLADFRRVGKLSACVEDHIDIEAAKENSPTHEVVVYYPLKRKGNFLTGSFVLPFHIRYHYPVENGTTEEIVIGEPMIFLVCNHEIPCIKNKPNMLLPCRECSPLKCEAYPLKYRTLEPVLIMRIPVGNLNNKFIVVLFTIVTSIGGAVYILISLVPFWIKPKKH